MKFSIKRAIADDGYILSFCEQLFLEHNQPEPVCIKGLPARMMFESEIWHIGEQLRQYLNTRPGNKNNNILLSQIIEVIKTRQYKSGRESFVMLLHFFKEHASVTEVLINLLHDDCLYGHAVRELNQMKIYIGGEKITELFHAEKTAWIKKELKKNFERSIKAV